MKLQELAEALQTDLEEGTKSFIVWQEGRKWKVQEYKTDSEEGRTESERIYFNLKNKFDDEAMIINGKKHFTDYDLKSIQNHIRHMRNKQVLKKG